MILSGCDLPVPPNGRGRQLCRDACSGMWRGGCPTKNTDGADVAGSNGDDRASDLSKKLETAFGAAYAKAMAGAVTAAGAISDSGEYRKCPANSEGRKRMICYTTVGINDLARATRFYEPLFAEMGLDRCWLDGTSASWGRKNQASFSRFSIGYPFDGNPATVGNGTMTAFLIDDPGKIDRLHELALLNGGRDAGGPGGRPGYGEGFYGAYVRDPDGNKLAFICYDGVVSGQKPSVS